MIQIGNKFSQYLTYIQRYSPETVEKVSHAIEKIEKEDSKEKDWLQFGVRVGLPLTALDENVISERDSWITCLQKTINQSCEYPYEHIRKGMGECKAWAADPKFFNAVLKYLREGISENDKRLLHQLRYRNSEGRVIPFTNRNQWSIGVVNPWPGGMSAEAEVLTRMRAAAEDADINLIYLSNFGHILDPKTQEQTEYYVDEKDLDFVISTHYDTFKSVDAFYYHTLWNPPEIPLNLDDYAGRVTDNYIMNDDFLIYDEGGMSKHLQCILQNSPRNLKNTSSLTASFPQNCILPPSLNNPKMFYCGMNWEKVVSHSNRHEGLFKLLDNTDKVKFFGPEKVEAWGGIRPWEGYKCYQYSIPFDGFSILDEINKCGVCLVLSSDIHRRAGATTNRAYEACAAGAVIISDNNQFMQKHFKDAALFITYNKENPEDTFKQIMDKYQWIVDHPDEALALAHKAQEIFIQKFALDKQLCSLVDNHSRRLQAVQDKLYAYNEYKVVLATFVFNSLKISDCDKLLKPVLQNIYKQKYSNIRLAVIADKSVVKDVEVYCKGRLYSAEVYGVELYDFKKSRYLTDAEALHQVYQIIPHDYFINMRAEEKWFSDHITSLVRSMIDHNALISYSGRLFEDEQGYRRTDMFRNITASTIYFMNCPDWIPSPGQILFSAECHELLPMEMLPYLDGYEHYAFLNAAVFKKKQTPIFSKRMSFCYEDGKFDERGSVIPIVMQIRLIRDYVKFDLPQNIIASSSNMKSEAMQVLNYLPIKKWLGMRMKRALLRVLPSNWSIAKRILDKYLTEINELEHIN